MEKKRSRRQCMVGKTNQKKKKKIINASLKLSIISKRYIILFDPSIGVMRRHKKFVP
jgi:hypothetical protein